MKTRYTRQVIFAMLITVAGGYMDTYSYLSRGKVFATGQTGNYVLFAIHLAQHDWQQVGNYLLPIVCFWAGVFFTKYLANGYKRNKNGTWQRNVLYIECLSFLVISFLPEYIPDKLVNAMISFCAAIQFCAFRVVGEHSAYASVFCTGNMRSCAEALYMGIIEKNQNELKNGLRYIGILLSFFVGVIFGVCGNRLFGYRAALGISLILMVAVIIYETCSSTSCCA